MYNLDTMNRDFEAAKQIVIDAGMPQCKNNSYVLDISKSKSFLGQTEEIGINKYRISLNRVYAETVSHDDLMNTLVHEVLHTLPHGMKHTGEWKQYAERIHAYNGMMIQRIHPMSESISFYNAAIEAQKAARGALKYIVVCPNCGKLRTFERRSKVVASIQKSENRYRCVHCQSKDLKIEIEPF